MRTALFVGLLYIGDGIVRMGPSPQVNLTFTHFVGVILVLLVAMDAVEFWKFTISGKGGNCEHIN